MPSHSPVLVPVPVLFLNPISVSYRPSQGDQAFHDKNRLLHSKASLVMLLFCSQKPIGILIGVGQNGQGRMF